MSFDSVTVVFHKDGHFHTLELTDQMVSDWSTTSPEWLSLKGVSLIDGSGVETVTARLEAAGYEIVSAVVRYDDYWAEEMVTAIHVPTAREFTEFYSLLQENEHDAGAILAYVHMNGFGDVGSWEDVVKFSGDTRSEIAQEWFDTFEMPQLAQVSPGRYGEVKYSELESLPYILSIDWESTLDNILADTGSSLAYLNGTYYMFG